MNSFNEHDKEMVKEEKFFDDICTKMKGYTGKQLIEFGAKAIADIFNAVAIDDMKQANADFDDEEALDFVALLLISYGDLVIGSNYSCGKRKNIEKMFRKAVSFAELPSAADLSDICEALFENENTPQENAEVFNLIYDESKDFDCELAHRLYIIGISLSLMDKLDNVMLQRCKEQMDVMGLHRYVNHKYDTPFMRDTKTGESYYSCDIDMGGESA